MKAKLADGKYEVVFDEGKLYATRYGESWRDLCGDNLIYWMLVDVVKYRELLEIVNAAKNCLVCAPIANTSEICETVHKMLESFDEEK
jgi:hypothetical protein